MVPSISNSHLGVSTSAGGKLILNTDKNGSHTTTNNDGVGGASCGQVTNTSALRKKIKPYKSN